jgi:hypothetical protein
MDDEGILSAVEDTPSSQGTPTKRPYHERPGPSSQQSLDTKSSSSRTSSSSSAASTPPEFFGLHMRADFSEEKPFFILKIENILMMMHMHLNGTIKDDDRVSSSLLSCFHL